MYTFKVEDMTCGGCTAAVSKAVSRVAGVRSVNADLQTKEVVVDAAAQVSSEAIFAAISDAGYSEVTLVAGPEAAAS